MKIHLSQYAGFCFGVKRAVRIAHEHLKKDKDIYIIEDIVHNRYVSEKLKKEGIKKVKDVEDIPKKNSFLINAHGVAKAIYEKAKKRDLKIIDTTCPIVKNIHKKAVDLEKEGYRVIIIGDRDHAETQGILGNVKEGIVIERVKDLGKIKNIPSKIGCISQSTQDIENVASIIHELVKKAEEVKFIKTICKEIEKRQEEIKKLSKKT
ncbi:MAG: 4-hydroxy-3-methylbut-2-enyl diphosphate reductase, partial [Candidatus Omnitrophota bacterium]